MAQWVLGSEEWSSAAMGGWGGDRGRRRHASSSADGGDDGNFESFADGSGEAAGVADIFVSDEDVDVLADLALFVDDAVASAGMEPPELG
jgi:hypothetical protein